MDDKPTPGAGDVKITLGGEEHVLKCSAEAAIAVSRMPGGFYGVAGQPGVAARILGCDIDTMSAVIRAGLGLSGSAVKGLEAMIYESGLLDIRSRLSGFIGALANGGKPIVVEGGDDADKGPPGAGA
jgi:hypothetical protein